MSPTYKYRCKNCGSEFEIIQGINSKPLAKCECGNITTFRLICAGGGLIFKGKGWPSKDIKRKEEGTYNKD